jgi:hypothetical protein
MSADALNVLAEPIPLPEPEALAEEIPFVEPKPFDKTTPTDCPLLPTGTAPGAGRNSGPLSGIAVRLKSSGRKVR